MVTVSSAFISSRRERIIFSVLSASGCAFKAAACVDVLRVLGKTDLDNTDVARDHSFHCIASAESSTSAHHTMHVGLTVSISSTPFPKFEIFVAVALTRTSEKHRDTGNLMWCSFSNRSVADWFPTIRGTSSIARHFVLQLPSRFRRPVDDRLSFMPVRKTQAGA